MLGNEIKKNIEGFRIHVVKSRETSVDMLVCTAVETYVTGVRDCINVPLNEARRAVDRLGPGHEIVTDDEAISKEFEIKYTRYVNPPW